MYIQHHSFYLFNQQKLTEITNLFSKSDHGHIILTHLFKQASFFFACKLLLCCTFKITSLRLWSWLDCRSVWIRAGILLSRCFFSFASSTSTQPRLGLVPRRRPAEGEAASELAASWRSVQRSPPVSAPVRIGLLAVRRHGRKALKWRTRQHFNDCNILSNERNIPDLRSPSLLPPVPIAPSSLLLLSLCSQSDAFPSHKLHLAVLQ